MIVAFIIWGGLVLGYLAVANAFRENELYKGE